MCKFRKAIGILFLVVIICMFMDLEVSQAATKEQLPPPPSEGILSDNPYKGESFSNHRIPILFSNKYLKDVKSFINISDNLVTISGYTNAYVSASTIGINLYIQRWNASQDKWVDVVDAGTVTRYNNSYISDTKNVIVPKGYYYRTRASHWLIESGVIERKQTYTSYLYIK